MLAYFIFILNYHIYLLISRSISFVLKKFNLELTRT